MRRIASVIGVILLFVPIFSFYIWGQSPTVTIPNEVFFNVSVLRKDSKSPVNLIEENFEISEGKEIKKITSFVKDGPASVVFVVDTTRTMQWVQPGEISSAVWRFVRAGNPLNEYATVALRNTVETLQGFTLDYQLVESSIAKIHKKPSVLDSPMFDALNVGISLFKEAKYKKKILVIFSDLTDRGSKTKFSQIKELVRQSNVIIYSIAPYLGNRDPSFAESEYHGWEMARVTGGNTFSYRDGRVLDLAVDLVVLSIEQLYLIGIEPSVKKDEWHEIDVKIVKTDKEFKKRVVVLPRAGYYFKPK